MTARKLLAPGLLLLVALLIAPPPGSAATTPLWHGYAGYSFNGGFDVVPSATAGMAWVFYGARASFGPDINRVYVFRAGPGQDQDWDMILSDPNDQDERVFGSDLAGVGDVNGDGLDDVVVCAPLSMTSLEPDFPAGFYLYLGGPQFNWRPDLEALIWAGEYRLIGRGVVGGGDFNGDGYDDFAIDAWRGDVSVAFIYFGGPLLDAEPDMIIDYVWVQTKRESTALFADLNGDGIDDFVARDTHSSAGFANVYLGRELPMPFPDWVLGTGGLSASLTAGDVNGDGYDDLVAVEGGKVEVFHGGPGFDNVADVVFLDDEDRFTLHHQGRARVIRADADQTHADVFVASIFGRSVLAFDGLADSTATPNYVFRPDGEPFYNSITAIFETTHDLDGDGAEELAIIDEAYRINIYKDLYFDCDGDGVPDEDEVAAGTLPDCDGNGLADGCELLVWPDLDCSGDGLIDLCQLETDDCDGNGIVDACDIASYPYLDCDENGLLDSCVPVPEGHDCDGNGLPDCREIAEDRSLDCTFDGILDACQYEQPYPDCNGNGNPDFCEIASNPAVDCNLDRIPDSCQWTEPGYDCNLNQRLDVCEDPSELTVDCDHNDQADLCEMATFRGLDCDGNGFLDACDAAAPPDSCLTPPHLGIYFDAALAVTNLTGELPVVGDLYIALTGLDPARAGAMEEFAFSLQLPAGITIVEGTSVYPAGAIDLNTATADWYVRFLTPYAVGQAGEVVLVHCNYFVQADPGPDARITVHGSQASGISTMWPAWLDGVYGPNRVLDTRSAWFGLTFVDCNDNGVDDVQDIAGGTSADFDGNGVPDECQELSDVPEAVASLQLHPPVPNPFNPMTTIAFDLPAPTRVRLTIHDAAGRLVATVLQADLPAGTHREVWQGRTDAGGMAASGVYFVRLETGREARTRKIALLR